MGQSAVPMGWEASLISIEQASIPDVIFHRILLIQHQSEMALLSKSGRLTISVATQLTPAPCFSGV